MKIRLDKNKNLAILCIFSFFMLIFLFSSLNFYHFQDKEQDIVNPKNILIQSLEFSGSWMLNDLIIDDDGGGDFNWSEAVLEPWCKGSGNYTHPYIIENVTFTASAHLDSLIIRDSSKYFKIKNCTFINSGSNGAGLLCDDAHNGTIEDCSFIYNYYGLYLLNSNNYTISNNNASNNERIGMWFRQSDYIFVINNTANNNSVVTSGVGLYFSSSRFSHAINNTANDNPNNGIYLYLSHNCTIFNNTANNNDYGIQLGYSDNNTLSNNSAYSNQNSGIRFLESNFNKLDKNNLRNNEVHGLAIFSSNNNTIYNHVNPISGSYYGIRIEASKNNSLFSNYFSENHIGIMIFESNNTNISQNTVFSNVIGIDLWKSNNNTIFFNFIYDNDINLNEDLCQGNIIENNKIIDKEESEEEDNGDDKNTKDSDKLDFEDFFYYLLLGLVIGAIVSVIPFMVYNYKNGQKIQKKDDRNRSLSTKKGKTAKDTSTREIIRASTNLERLEELFEEHPLLNEKFIEKTLLTTIDPQFLKKVDKLGFNLSDKIDFIREMLSFNPAQRENIIDDILEKIEHTNENGLKAGDL